MDGMNVKTHGRNGYDRGCRCEVCSKAKSDWAKLHYRKGRWGTVPARHGQSGYTTYGCRCEVCTDAQKQYDVAYRLKHSVELNEYHFDKYTRKQGSRLAQWRLNGVLKDGNKFVLSDYDAMFEACGGKCESCGKDLLKIRVEKGCGNQGVACVDHDHETGEARGILCQGCNKAFGLLGDDFERVRALARYAELKSGFYGCTDEQPEYQPNDASC